MRRTTWKNGMSRGKNRGSSFSSRNSLALPVRKKNSSPLSPATPLGWDQSLEKKFLFSLPPSPTSNLLLGHGRHRSPPPQHFSLFSVAGGLGLRQWRGKWRGKPLSSSTLPLSFPTKGSRFENSLYSPVGRGEGGLSGAAAGNCILIFHSLFFSSGFLFLSGPVWTPDFFHGSAQTAHYVPPNRGRRLQRKGLPPTPPQSPARLCK